MHEGALRTVLLIRSIDEGDKNGEVLSLAERSEATQAAAHGAATIQNGLAGPSLPVAAERILVRRAELLRTKLEARAPVVGPMLDAAGGAASFGSLLLLAALITGLAMSALDGRHHIDILAFPLLGLIGWNAIVYLALFVDRVRPKRKRSAGASWLSSLYTRWVRGRADGLLKQASLYNLPLTAAMQRFVVDWAGVVRPLLVLRAKRLFHAGAALLALGLVAGLYVRGLVLRYDAGWDSTFLDAGQVRALIGVLYGAASALSGIELPAPEQMESLRWRADEGGAPAAPWIHLIALTAVLTIVLPRAFAALLNTLALWRARRSPELPETFLPYARTILLETGRVSGMTAGVVSYAYEPSGDALEGLHVLLSEAPGGQVKVESRAAIAYGDEDDFVERLRSEPLPPADCQVLLMSLSATPESENHGAMIAALRQRRTRKSPALLVVIDESVLAARLGGDAALANRLLERARTWREFVASQEVPACVVNLNQLRPGRALDPSALRDVRAALQRSAGA